MAKVLIVEDNDSMRNFMARFVSIAGHKTIECHSTTEAERLVDIECPDMVLTDHDLAPREEKGLELATRLKEKGVRVIVMSADPNIKTFAEERGVPFYYKLDPVTELLSQVKEACHV